MNRDAYAIAVGDPVEIRYGYGTSDGTVIKIGRKLVHIKTGSRIMRFRRDTQRIDSKTEYSVRFRTIPQVKDEARRIQLLGLLRENGVELRRGNDWNADTMSLLLAYVKRLRTESEGTS